MTARNLEMNLAARNSDGRTEGLPFAWHFEISGEKCRFSSWKEKMILESFKLVSYKATDSNSFTIEDRAQITYDPFESRLNTEGS